jgi:hypothetical protein
VLPTKGLLDKRRTSMPGDLPPKLVRKETKKVTRQKERRLCSPLIDLELAAGAPWSRALPSHER